MSSPAAELMQAFVMSSKCARCPRESSVLIIPLEGEAEPVAFCQACWWAFVQHTYLRRTGVHVCAPPGCAT